MRRVTYKLYPNKTQEIALLRVFEAHRQLYNAALQERIEAYRKAGISISYLNQCKSLTAIRSFDETYRAINAQSAQVTLKRLDDAFKHFFRRVKAGQTPGFPRFKSRDRFPGFGFKTHGDGFKFTPGANWKHGTLRLSGIGEITARGEARTPGRVVCCDIQRKADGWFLSLVVDCDPFREKGTKEAGLDWGVETFVTLAYGEGDYAAIDNDRLYQETKDAIIAKQRGLTRKRSKRAARQRRLLAKAHRRLANRRKNRAHQISTALVRDHAAIYTEDLSIKNMTRSASGTTEKPGKQVAQKAGLNREVLDTAPALLFQQLSYKAEEAGMRLVFIKTRKHKPSQTCPSCGCIRKKGLSVRMHICDDCGFAASRDEASALLMLRVGKDMGQELAPNIHSETPPIAA